MDTSRGPLGPPYFLPWMRVENCPVDTQPETRTAEKGLRDPGQHPGSGFPDMKLWLLDFLCVIPKNTVCRKVEKYGKERKIWKRTKNTEKRSFIILPLLQTNTVNILGCALLLFSFFKLCGCVCVCMHVHLYIWVYGCTHTCRDSFRQMVLYSCCSCTSWVCNCSVVKFLMTTQCPGGTLPNLP